MKDDRLVATKRSKKDAKDSKDTTQTERPTTGDQVATNPAPTALPINNNVSKNSSSSSTRPPESVGNRTRTNSRLTQPSIDSSNDKRVESSDTRKFPPVQEEKRLRKNSCENRERNSDLSSSASVGRRTSDTVVKKLEFKLTEAAGSVVAEEKCKLSNLNELEVEIISKSDLGKKESREKGKAKKKTKASRREEREREKRSKDKNSSKQQDRVESEDSGSDSSSEKYIQEVKNQQLARSEKKSRRSSLPSLISNSNKLSNVSVGETQDSISKPKNRKNQSEGKKAKSDTQPSKAKNPESISKKGSQASVVADTRAESAHSIATAVSLALEKSLQTACKENTYDEPESSIKKKVFPKGSNLSPRLRDSPPPVSPTSLSGSSRSSSYSSIVSSDSASSTPDHTKGKGKPRVISSKSLPLGELSLLFPGVAKDQAGL